MAKDLVDEFAGSVTFVSLAAIAAPDLVAFAIALALGVGEVADRPLWQRLQEYLAERRLLLVLVNAVDYALATEGR